VMVVAYASVGGAFAQWYRIPQLQYTNIYCLLAMGDSTVFVGGDNSVFLRTTDGGSTWTNLITWQNGLEVDTILSLEKAGGYIFAGTNSPGSLYRSSDDGDSWSPIGQGFPPNTAVNGMTCSNGVIYAAASTGVYSSNDNGGSWSVDTTGLNMAPWYRYTVTPGGIVGIVAIDSTLFAVRSWDVQTPGGVYMMRANSIAWKPIGLESLSTYGLYAIVDLDSNVFVGTADGIYRYSGSGTIWLPRNNGLPLSDTTWLQSCLFTTVDTLLFAYISYTSTYVYNKGIYVTSDLGQTWEAVSDSVFSDAALNAMAATPKFLFAGTQSGAWRIPISDIVTAVNDRMPQLPSGFALYQNYPNPFNPTTVIRYQIPTVTHVTLKIYDVLGRELKTLVVGRQNAGDHSVTFDARHLPSGVYFYTLRACSYAKSGKMLLLK
jgi:hypothetical protein